MSDIILRADEVKKALVRKAVVYIYINHLLDIWQRLLGVPAPVEYSYVVYLVSWICEFCGFILYHIYMGGYTTAHSFLCNPKDGSKLGTKNGDLSAICQVLPPEPYSKLSTE